MGVDDLGNTNTPATGLDQLLSKKQAASLIGVSVRTLERAIAAGAIDRVRVLSRVLIRSSVVERIQNDGLSIKAETEQRHGVAG